MRRALEACVIVTLLCALAAPPAAAAEASPPGSDPGHEIGEGFVKIGHGIRDGAVNTWGAVKSVFNGSNNTSDKKASSAPSKASGSSPESK
jgi:hypothetical protein